ncbi:related to centromere binding factor 1 [Sporisorium reilianum SRZ2]|uniref:Related to centromere binding factor 1 n=1 Tax=Sporisorium reilianum (strain SRZ2) TaxID=999809 RepID=E6ZVD7_SPORE|nr:related to centromere binding factor 1 [Sporisorium reilianum SRZ2]
MSSATETTAAVEPLANDPEASTHDADAAAASNDAGSAAAAAAAAEAAAAVLDSTTNPAERDHIERDVSNILAGLNQEQLASIVAAARASEARNADGSAAGEGEGGGEGFGQSTTYGLGQAASALTSIASGFKRTPGNDRTNLGTTSTADADGKDLGDAPPPPGTEYQAEDEKELDADTSAAIAAVKSATDTATAAALASLGSLAASQSAAAAAPSAPSAHDAPDADESMDYDSRNGSASPSRSLKRPRGPELDRQRKDNHKEVERRRRSAINDGITQLSHIVPGCDAKNTNKGAIIHAAVRYIQDLKHNEASNIEKWTLEKLLMDQAMGDLTAQLDEAQQQIERLRHELDQRYAEQHDEPHTKA